MRKIIGSTLLASLFALNLSAQEATAPAADAAAAPAQSVQRPQEITRNVHDDWQIRCTTGEQQQCYMTQLVLGPNQNPLMEVTMIPAKIEGQPDAIMGATIVSPLNVMLQQGLLIQIDEALPERKEYSFCAQVGCYTRFPMTQKEVDVYAGAGKITASLFALNSPTQAMEIGISLKGFKAAFDELMEIEAEMKK